MQHSKIQGFSEKFINGAIAGSGFALTILVISVVYAVTLNYSVPVNRVTSGSGLSSTEWNKMVTNFETLDTQLTNVTTQVATLNTTTVPSGAIMAFNLGTCPTNWSPADGTGGRPDLRGEFIRGLDNGRNIDTGRVLGSWQVDEFKSHTHGNGVGGVGTGYPNGIYWNMSAIIPFQTNATGGNETRPRNVAFLYCIKN
ncbi:MAG: hypothetical protein WC774_02120 [Candidatus Gracilibacteria bacterium]|jgi:hypothetical protein